MSKFVLTAQLQLQAPNNVGQVVQQIQNQLSGVKVNVKVQGNAQAQQQVQQLTKTMTEASGAASNLGRTFAMSLKRFTAFAVATRAVSLFTNTLSASIEEAISFERQLVKISQVTGTAINQLGGLVGEVNSLATSLGVSSKSLLNVSEILAQAGLSASDTKIALNALAKSALAPTFDDIASTAEGAVAILAQFKEGSAALEGQLGSLNAVAGKFAVEAGDLVDVIRRSGGVFKASGGSLNELIALFTSVRATTRESAESIATGLRTIFTRIQRPKTIEFLKQFGVELTDIEGKFVGPYEAIKRLSEGLKGLGEGDITFIKIAEELGGFRQIGKVIPLLREFKVAQDALNVAQKGSKGLAQDAATAQLALAIRITKVKEEFLALVRSITETKSFQIFANTALNLASALIKLADSLSPLIPLLTAVASIKIAQGIGSFITGFKGGIGSKKSFSEGGKVHYFAKGGLVPGSGSGDTVPAMLTPGEFVVKKSSVNRIGADNLHAMNRHAGGGKIQQFAEGGRSIVGATTKLKTTQKRDGKYGSLKDVPGTGNIQFDVKQGQIGAFVLSPAKGTEGGYNASQPFPFVLKPGTKGFERYKNIIASQAGLSVDDLQGGINATVNPATYPVFYPGLTEGRTNLKNNSKYASAVHKGFLDSISAGVNSTIQSVSSQGLLDIPPAFNTNEQLLKNTIGKIQSDNQVRSSIEGYLFEGMISAFTGASAAGGTSNFDFPRSAISQNKSRLGALFGSQEEINKLIKAEAKRSYGEVGGNIQRKLANDIIAGNISGATVRTSGQKIGLKKKDGGIIQKFVGGGISKAPLVDDILSNAKGSILPRPSDAIASLIKAGGGAIDIDRTIKRTLGDKAYGAAKTPSEKAAALNKYFKDPVARLQDIKASPLTSFGKELQTAVQSKQLNPRKLSIVTQSKRVPGVAEYLSQLFGIPAANMIFTGGGSKEPAMEAIRTKGPRVERIKRAIGGKTDPKKSLEKYFAGSNINTQLANTTNLTPVQRKELATDVKNIRSLRTPAPSVLYSSLSRVAFDRMASQVSLNKNPKIPENAKLVEQEGFYDQAAKKTVGKSFNLPGFVSTSKEYSKAKTFLDNAPRDKDNWAALLTIQTKPKAQGVDVAQQLSGRKLNITKQGINPRTGKPETLTMNPPEAEQEVILQPRSRFKVASAQVAKLGVNKNLLANVQQFKDGGTVPALVSNGEAYVPPNVAKRIGYGNLHRMNQADRAPTSKFSEGGISVFKGPGSGTSDSIPVNLPVGSFIIREKATKALGLSTGGKVPARSNNSIFNNVKRFFVGGVAEKQVSRTAGYAEYSNIDQAANDFAKIIAQLGPEIAEKIKKGFTGIENVKAGETPKFNQGKFDAFKERQRGVAMLKPSNQTTAIGLQIKGRGAAANTNTLAHETGHIADFALGGNKTAASTTKGTFQFKLVEKVKPQMEAAFKAAGESAENIKTYLANNQELFAEFFAKASPEVRAIITSTTDSKKGMAALKSHLEKAGHTYAGLEASDIPTLPSKKSTAAPVATSPATAVATGGLGDPGSMAKAPTPKAVAAATAASAKPATPATPSSSAPVATGAWKKLETDIKGYSITIQESKALAQRLMKQEQALTDKIKRYDSEIIKLTESAKSGASGNKALKRIVDMKIKAEEKRLSVGERAIEAEEKVTIFQRKRSDLIAQAKAGTQKQEAVIAQRSGLRGGSPGSFAQSNQKTEKMEFDKKYGTNQFATTSGFTRSNVEKASIDTPIANNGDCCERLIKAIQQAMGGGGGGGGGGMGSVGMGVAGAESNNISDNKKSGTTYSASAAETYSDKNRIKQRLTEAGFSKGTYKSALLSDKKVNKTIANIQQQNIPRQQKLEQVAAYRRDVQTTREEYAKVTGKTYSGSSGGGGGGNPPPGGGGGGGGNPPPGGGGGGGGTSKRSTDAGNGGLTGFGKFNEALLATSFALSSLTPVIDENSTAFEKGIAKSIEGLSFMSSVLLGVNGLLSIFGTDLGKIKIGNLTNFLTGGIKGGSTNISGKLGTGVRADRLMAANPDLTRYSALRQAVKSPGSIASQVGDIASGGVSKLSKIGMPTFAKAAPTVGRLASVGTAVAGPALAATAIIGTINSVVGNFRDLDGALEKAIKSGDDVAIAQASMAKAASEFPIIGNLVSTFFGSGADAWLIGIQNFFGGQSAEQVRTAAINQAQAGKAAKALADASTKATKAMKDFEDGNASALDVVKASAGGMEGVAKFKGTTEAQIAANESQKGGVTRDIFTLGGLLGENSSQRNTRIDKENEALRTEVKTKQAEGYQTALPGLEVLQKQVAATGGSFDDFIAQVQAASPALAAYIQQEGATALGLSKSFENIAKEAERTRKAFDAMNLGFQNVSAASAALGVNLDNYMNSQQAGFIQTENTMRTLEASITNAAQGISDNDFSSALGDASNSLRQLGASDSQIKKFEENLGAINTAQKSFASISEETKSRMKAEFERGAGGAKTTQERRNVFSDVVAKQLENSGIGEEVRGRIKDALANAQLSDEDMTAVMNGDFSKLDGILQNLGETTLKDVIPALQEYSKYQKVLVDLAQKRIEAENKVIESQRAVLEAQLEAAEIISKYGGKELTPQMRVQNAVAQANVQASGVKGISQLRTGSADELNQRSVQIRSRLAEISNIQDRVASGDKSASSQTGGVAGKELEAERQRLLELSKSDYETTKKLISIREEELKLIGEKNKAEKDSIDALVSGDIDKFFKLQQQEGAKAAIATGSRTLQAAYGPEALGAAAQDIKRLQESGVTSLYGQQLSGAGGLTERAYGSALGARGITGELNTRMAQTAAGTTAEEEAKKAEIRGLAATLPNNAETQLQNSEADKRNAEIQYQAAEMQLEAARKQVEARGGGEMVGQGNTVMMPTVQGRAHGGLIYANNGIFVPRGTDTVPAMLTPGEFVVNRAAVQRGNNLQVLQAMNRGSSNALPSANQNSGNASAAPMSQGGVVRYRQFGSTGPESGGGMGMDQLTSALNNFNTEFSKNIDKLSQTNLSIKLDATNINVNLSDGGLLQKITSDLKKEIMSEVGNKIKNEYSVGEGGRLQENRSTIGK